ncbi:MAG: acyltransferase family protein [Vulcanimicrobiota bacterium]
MRSEHGSRCVPLDGLRGVAILLVVWLHASFAGYVATPRWFPFGGRTGVALFFVLSGYLITSLLLAEQKEHGRFDLKQFYIRRTVRIFPIFYLYVLVLVLLRAAQVVYTDTFSLLVASSYLVNWFHTHLHHNLEHAWSLSYEEQFYLVWPLLLRWLGKRRAGWLALGLGLGWPLLRILKNGTLDFSPATMLQATGFGTLMMGCALAIFLEDSPARPWAATPVISVLAVLGLHAYATQLPGVLLAFLPTLRDVALTALVWWSVVNRASLLRFAPLVAVGRVSYSLYVWHPLFISRLEVPFARGWPAWLALLACTLASYWLLERPLAAYRARFRRSGGAQAVSPPSS